MTERVTPLTELERDALAELSNVAMARAATSLRQMVKTEVLLSVPTVEIMTPNDAAQAIAKPGNPNLVAIRQDFTGAFSGRALLIFPETTSLELVRVVVGRELPLEDIVDLEDEALARDRQYHPEQLDFDAREPTEAKAYDVASARHSPRPATYLRRRQRSHLSRAVPPHQIRNSRSGNWRLCGSDDGYSVDRRTQIAYRAVCWQRDTSAGMIEPVRPERPESMST